MLNRALEVMKLGNSLEEAVDACVTHDIGPEEMREVLREEAQKALAILPPDYNPEVRKYIMQLGFNSSEEPQDPEDDGTQDLLKLGLKEAEEVPSELGPSPKTPEAPVPLAPQASALSLLPSFDPSRGAVPAPGVVLGQQPSANQPALLAPTAVSPLSANTFYRPLPQPVTPLLAPPGQLTDARHVGAYSSASLALPMTSNEEVSKALNSIAHAMKGAAEPSVQKKGELSSIGKPEEVMVYMLRCCDTNQVT